jgi:hypothetical protein
VRHDAVDVVLAAAAVGLARRRVVEVLVRVDVGVIDVIAAAFLVEQPVKFRGTSRRSVQRALQPIRKN